jgi:histidine triad (HIT) family protein
MVHQDALCSVLMDIQPVNPGHVLVIPNQHAAYLADLEEETGAHMFRIAQRTAAALRVSGVQCEGVNFFLADGEAAMQDVFHVHLHVFPRYPGDGFGLKLSPDYFTLPERSELDGIAEDIRNALESTKT